MSGGAWQTEVTWELVDASGALVMTGGIITQDQFVTSNTWLYRRNTACNSVMHQLTLMMEVAFSCYGCGDQQL